MDEELTILAVVALALVLFLFTRRWFRALVFFFGGLASLFSMLASIIHFQMEKIKIILGVPILVLFSVLVSANPTERDWQTEGDGLITYDSNTGLEWLDLTVTADLTYIEVYYQLGPGGTYEGWHFASTSQVSTLWDNFGGSGVYVDWSTENNGLFQTIATLMGDLYCEIYTDCEIGTGISQFITSDIYNGDADSRVVSRMQDFISLGQPAAEVDFFSVEYTYTPIEGIFGHGATLGSALIREFVDSDDDTVPDSLDNCTLIANPNQRDTDGDGFGNRCDADFDQNCVVNFIDLGIMQAFFLLTGDFDTDLNGDGVTNFLDISIFASGFLLPPGPSGVTGECSGL